jgi:2-polyprenyl-3-methyl-5-hydroxy-6-metoxy-1,4-benzoquinol methylase
LVCPRCGDDVAADGSDLHCGGCDARYPVVAGIPDLRLGYPDPYVSWEEDVVRARELAARFDELDLVGLLREHWRRSGKRPELAERFLARDMVTIRTSAAYLGEIERFRGRPLGPQDRFHEVGCGTAGLAAAAAEREGTVVASDISLRCLVLAKKRLSESGTEGIELVCCAAEDPPFRPGAFTVVGASDVIEHVADAVSFAAGCERMLAPDGLLFLATPNRFSLALEPHVRLWGVGFLPRGLARRYVRRVRKASYDHVRLLSSRGLRRTLARAGLQARVEPPAIPASAQVVYSGVEARLVRAYNRIRRLPGVRRALLAFGPFFHVFGTKGEP